MAENITKEDYDKLKGSYDFQLNRAVEGQELYNQHIKEIASLKKELEIRKKREAELDKALTTALTQVLYYKKELAELKGKIEKELTVPYYKELEIRIFADRIKRELLSPKEEKR